MALGPRLDLRQSQSLVMTPQLQQAIKLLALSNLELEAYLAEALEGNPLLDTAPADRDEGGADEGGEEAPPAADVQPDTDAALSSDAGTADDLDVDFAEERFHHDSASDSVGLSGEASEGIDFDSFAEHDGTHQRCADRRVRREGDVEPDCLRGVAERVQRCFLLLLEEPRRLGCLLLLLPLELKGSGCCKLGGSVP